MQRNGQDQFCRPFVSPLRTLILFVHMHMGRQHVQAQQETDADQEADCRRQESKLPHAGAFIQCGLQQAPEGRRDHHPGREAGQGLPYAIGNLFFQKENRCRSQAGAKERNQDSLNNS